MTKRPDTFEALAKTQVLISLLFEFVLYEGDSLFGVVSGYIPIGRLRAVMGYSGFQRYQSALPSSHSLQDCITSQPRAKQVGGAPATAAGAASFSAERLPRSSAALRHDGAAAQIRGIALQSAFVLLLLYGSACASAQVASNRQPSPASGVATQVGETSSGHQETGPVLQQHYPRYLIGFQDVLQVSFPLSPEFDETVTVQPDGYVSLKAAAPLHVQGLAVPEVEYALRQAYVGVLHDPIINVDLRDFQKPSFTVTGQVGRPGRYDLRTDTTVNEALAIAGGLSPTAKTQVFLFRRSSRDWFEVKKLNLKDILNGKHANEDVLMQPGDLIYVPETFITSFKKYVPYSLSTYLAPNPF